MNAYKFADLPSNSSVASLVTLLVSGWFLVAAGAILSDPPSTYTQRALPQVRETLTVVAKRSDFTLPQARETLTVVARRSDFALPQARETLTVVARRLDHLPASTTL